MLIKNCIYTIMILISIISVLSLIYSIKNKNKYISKWISIIDVTYIVYLVVLTALLDFLYLPTGFELLVFNALEILVIVILLVSAIICNFKKKVSKHNQINKKVIPISILLIVLPVLFLSIYIVGNKQIINNSNVVLVYRSMGNGGIGDSKTFAVAIGEDYCKEFDLGISNMGLKLKNYIDVPKTKIDTIDDISNYKVIIDERITVYKNGKKICNIKTKSHYFNIDLERGYILDK